MNEVLKRISDIGIIPVIAFNRVEEAVPLCRALVAGGLPAAEVTFRTACAEDCIKIINKEVPDMLLGAGTVLTIDQADRAKAGKWDEITAICKEAVKTMLGFSLAHVGINCENETEAQRATKTICSLFDFDYKPGNSSIFADSAVECMKSPYLGRNGHIAIGTNSLDRAIYHLGRQGVEFDESTRKPKAIYLKGEVGGFAIHLVEW